MTLLAQSGATTAIILGGLALVTGWLLLRTHSSFRRQRGGGSTLVETPRPAPEPQGHNLGAPDDVARWEVRMHETARELSAELDSKMRALRVLIEEADRAAARLEAAQLEAATGGPPAAADSPASDAVAAGDQAQALKLPPSQPPPSEKRNRTSARQRRQEIFTLSDYGYGAPEIAQRIGVPVGEVELVLGLREGA